jgi:hypothetical protein
MKNRLLRVVEIIVLGGLLFALVVPLLFPPPEKNIKPEKTSVSLRSLV